ncbi:MAG: alanine--tRNA ligase, partial [Bacteroidales bacterium]|nr:alanine--tRNA ligase [Bacteroidales bacterium]
KDTLLKNAREVKGCYLVALKGIFIPEVVKNEANLLRQECTNTVFVAATHHEEKPTLTLMYTDDLVAKGMHAGKDIREAAKLINGGGGGQPFLATAGGKNIDGLAEAFDKLVEIATK